MQHRSIEDERHSTQSNNGHTNFARTQRQPFEAAAPMKKRYPEAMPLHQRELVLPSIESGTQGPGQSGAPMLNQPQKDEPIAHPRPHPPDLPQNSDYHMNHPGEETQERSKKRRLASSHRWSHDEVPTSVWIPMNHGGYPTHPNTRPTEAVLQYRQALPVIEDKRIVKQTPREVHNDVEVSELQHLMPPRGQLEEQMNHGLSFGHRQDRRPHADVHQGYPTAAPLLWHPSPIIYESSQEVPHLEYPNRYDSLHPIIDHQRHLDSGRANAYPPPLHVTEREGRSKPRGLELDPRERMAQDMYENGHVVQQRRVDVPSETGGEASYLRPGPLIHIPREDRGYRSRQHKYNADVQYDKTHSRSFQEPHPPVYNDQDPALDGYQCSREVRLARFNPFGQRPSTSLNFTGDCAESQRARLHRQGLEDQQLRERFPQEIVVLD